MATAAFLNYWLVVSLLAAWIGWAIVDDVDDDFGVPPIIMASAAMGAIIALVYVVSRLHGVRDHTIDRLGAVEVRPGEFPRLQNLVEELAVAAGTPPVATGLLADPAPNALTVGRRPDETTIVVTSGLVELLTRDELEAVLAAEFAAVRRLDAALQTTVVACESGAAGINHRFRESWWDPRIWLAIVLTWPSKAVAGVLRRSAFEAYDFGADEMAVGITRHPDALLGALVKLREDPRVVEMLSFETAPLWFEPIPHDDDARAARYQQLAMTAALDDRIARVRSLVPGASRSAYGS